MPTTYAVHITCTAGAQKIHMLLHARYPTGFAAVIARPPFCKRKHQRLRPSTKIRSDTRVLYSKSYANNISNAKCHQ